jgi:5-methylphenazine-1-carboxylate 1-monooxygenase
VKVIVAGAGLGGLTAALSLHAAGIDALVIDEAITLRPLGVGINLMPHAVRELTELGLGDELAARHRHRRRLPSLRDDHERVLEQVDPGQDGRARVLHAGRGPRRPLIARRVAARLGQPALRRRRLVPDSAGQEDGLPGMKRGLPGLSGA